MYFVTLAKIVSPPMQCEFRAGLSQAQCSIAYNGNMGVCNQCQRYRWRLTMPRLFCSSRVFIETFFYTYREISVQQTPGNKNVGSTKQNYTVESKIYIQNTQWWIHHWYREISPQRNRKRNLWESRDLYRFRI